MKVLTDIFRSYNVSPEHAPLSTSMFNSPDLTVAARHRTSAAAIVGQNHADFLAESRACLTFQ